MKTELFAIIAVFLVSFLGAIGQYYFKRGANTLQLLNPKTFLNKYLLYAVALYVSGAVAYVLVLPYGELSVLYPIVASNFIWVLLIAKAKLNEKIDLRKVLGIGCIIVGIVLIGINA